MISDPASAAARHDPGQWRRTLRYRDRTALPFNRSAAPPSLPVLLDATVYVDRLKGHLPLQIESLLADRRIVHAAPALAELSIAIGVLDPSDSRTAAALAPLRSAIEAVTANVLAPSTNCWVEAGVLAGILARTQGIAKTDRRKLQIDALLFLMAEEAGAMLLSRNVRDFDLLLQIKPGVAVLLYDRA